MDHVQPLDAIISGCAYEYATTSLGVLEKGPKALRGMSTEMLCTLDNFIKVILFCDRVFYDICVGGDAKPKWPDFGASSKAKRLFDREGIFLRIPEFEGDTESVYATVADALRPVDSQAEQWVVLTCEEPSTSLEISQEMTCLDVFVIEYAIARGGLQKFKPVFPGEHLYLGLRQSRVHSLGATHTIADVAGRRVRAVVRQKMNELNTLVTLGAPPLPTVPPLFVTRLVHDCEKGSDVIPTLFEIRKSLAVTRFRKWATQCMEWIASEDVEKRTKGKQAYDHLMGFSLTAKLKAEDWGKASLKTGKAIQEVVKGDFISAMSEVFMPVAYFLAGLPLSFLKQFGGKKGNPKKLDSFLTQTFGDSFHRSEMDFVANLLWLPDNVSDWKGQSVKWDVRAGRLDPAAPPLARPCFITSKRPHELQDAKEAFEKLWEKGEPLRTRPRS